MPRRTPKVQDMAFHEKLKDPQRRLAYIVQYAYDHNGAYPPDIPKEIAPYYPHPTTKENDLIELKKTYIALMDKTDKVESLVFDWQDKMHDKYEQMEGRSWAPEDEAELLKYQDEKLKAEKYEKELYANIAELDAKIQGLELVTDKELMLACLDNQLYAINRKIEETQRYFTLPHWEKQHPEAASKYKRLIRMSTSEAERITAVKDHELLHVAWAGN